MRYQVNDGGRAAAGFKGHAGDCVARALAITTGRPYREVYDVLAAGNASERRTKRGGRIGREPRRTARNGIHTTRKWFVDLVRSWGFEWTPLMAIGGTKYKTTVEDFATRPGARILHTRKHVLAVIDGVAYDTEPNRPRTPIDSRTVYGFWQLKEKGNT